MYEGHRQSCRDITIKEMVHLSDRYTLKSNLPCEHEELCMWNTYSGIKCYMYADKLCAGTPHRSRFPDVTPDPPKLRNQANQRVLRATEWTAIFRFVTLVMGNTFATDEVTRGMRCCFDTWTIPVWSNFAMCVFLDIQDMMGDAVGSPLKELQDDLRSTLKEHEDNRIFGDPFSLRDLKDTVLNHANDILEHHRNFVLEDTFGNVAREHGVDTSGHKVLEPLGLERDFILKRHPLRCGTLQYDLHLQMQASGYSFERNSPLISVLSHIYVAGCLLFLEEDTAWPDMEFMLWRQDPSYLFYGGRPQTLAEAHNKYKLAIGSPLAGWASNARGQGIKYDWKKTRFFQNPSLLSKHFLDRMAAEPRSSSEVSDIVRGLMNMICDPASKTRLRAQQNFVHEPPSSVPEGSKSWQPLKLLEEFHEWAIADGIDTSFDWFKMQQICVGIWEKIIVAMRTDNSSYKVDNPIDTAGQFFGRAATIEKLRKPDQTLAETAAQYAPELHTIWRVIQDTINTEVSEPDKPKVWVGDTCINRLLRRTPDAIKTFSRDGPGAFSNIYQGWTVSKLTYAKLTAWWFMCDTAVKEMERVKNGELHCEVCNVVHDPENVPYVAQEHRWFMSPSRALEYIDGVKLEDYH